MGTIDNDISTQSENIQDGVQYRTRTWLHVMGPIVKQWVSQIIKDWMSEALAVVYHQTLEEKQLYIEAATPLTLSNPAIPCLRQISL